MTAALIVPLSFRGDLLGGDQSFEAGVVPLALALFGDHQDFHVQITRASNFKFFDQFGGDFFGSASDEFGFFGFCGHVDLFDFLRGLDGDAQRFTRDAWRFLFSWRP